MFIRFLTLKASCKESERIGICTVEIGGRIIQAAARIIYYSSLKGWIMKAEAILLKKLLQISRFRNGAAACEIPAYIGGSPAINH